MQIKTIFLTSLGFLFLVLGAIGLLLPVWPTTPFVLLSASCFSSSPRAKAFLMGIAFFRDHIENYERRTGLSRKTVVISMLWLWGMLFLSMAMIRSLMITVLLITIGVAVTIHILYMAKSNDLKKAQTP